MSARASRRKQGYVDALAEMELSSLVGLRQKRPAWLEAAAIPRPKERAGSKEFDVLDTTSQELASACGEQPSPLTGAFGSGSKRDVGGACVGLARLSIPPPAPR